MNTPNKLTVLRIIMTPFFLAALMINFPHHHLVALVLFAAASITDLIDGKIARKYNLISNFGKFADPLADKILVYSAFCLFIGNLMPAWMLIVILTREFVVSGIRAVAASEGIVIAAGMSGKIKTVLQMIAVPMMLIVPIIPTDIVFYYITMGFLWASLIMTVYSGVEYVVKNRKVLSP